MARLQRPKLQTSANLSPTATPACGLCSESLKISEDKLKTYNRFYKNCKSCRNKKQEYNRRVSSQSLMARKERKGKLQRFKSDLEAREQNGSITQPFFIADSDSNSSTKEKTPAAFGPSDTAIGPEVIDVENLHTGPADGPLTPPPTQQECSVCAEEYPIRDFPKLEACTHETDICHTCFLTWLDQQLSSTTWEQFTCPSSNCKNRISHHDVKALAPMDVYTRFDELSMRSILSADPTFFYCPNSNCKSGQIHDTSAEGNIFRCNACGHRVCTDHDPHVPFHEGETCTQYTERIAREIADREDAAVRKRERQQQDEASLVTVKRDAVECPGCGVMIHKTAGCDHMTCGRAGCLYEFCYRCRAPYAGIAGIRRIGNAAHYTGCSYRPESLPNYDPPAGEV